MQITVECHRMAAGFSGSYLHEVGVVSQDGSCDLLVILQQLI